MIRAFNKWVRDSPLVTLVVTISAMVGGIVSIAGPSYNLWKEYQKEQQKLVLGAHSATLLELNVPWSAVLQHHTMDMFTYPSMMPGPLLSDIFPDDPTVRTAYRDKNTYSISDLQVFGIRVQLRPSNPSSSSQTIHSCTLLLSAVRVGDPAAHQASLPLSLYFVGNSEADLTSPSIKSSVRLSPGETVDQYITFPLLHLKTAKLGIGVMAGGKPQSTDHRSILSCLDQAQKIHESSFNFSLTFLPI